MSSKNNAQVNIDGRLYTLSGYESEDYLQKVAGFINKKIVECKTSDGFRRLPVETQQIMIHLNIADEYFRAKKQADTLESEIDSKDKEIYDLKHELIAAQIRIDTMEQENKSLRENVSDYQKQIVKLETEVDGLRK